MTLAKHAGAWLIVGTLVYALLTYSPRWPEVVVGLVGAGLFAVAEVDELWDRYLAWRHRDKALRFAPRPHRTD